ncbi:hypothetical protein [Zavarzinella formosa]|uniref:hypothetical protein n=1 Tax=Zavarzinella formosa TaxID=360055 RepID=UPI001EE67032|nr:hypothetical protein [Zavarzinella formosa]
MAKKPKPDMPLPAELAGLAEKLRHKDAKVKIAALEALAQKGEAAEPAATAVCNCLIEDSEEITKAALRAIEKIHPKIYPLVASMVLDPTVRDRSNSVKKLGLLGKEAKCVQNFLIHRMSHEIKDFIANYMSEGASFRLDPDRAKNYLFSIEVFAAIQMIDESNEAAFDCLIKYLELEQLAKVEYPEAAPWRGILQWEPATKLADDWAGQRKERVKKLIAAIESEIKTGPYVLVSLALVKRHPQESKHLAERIKDLKLSTYPQIRDAAKQALDAIEADM